MSRSCWASFSVRVSAITCRSALDRQNFSRAAQLRFRHISHGPGTFRRDRAAGRLDDRRVGLANGGGAFGRCLLWPACRSLMRSTNRPARKGGARDLSGVAARRRDGAWICGSAVYFERSVALRLSGFFRSRWRCAIWSPKACRCISSFSGRSRLEHGGGEQSARCVGADRRAGAHRHGLARRSGGQAQIDHGVVVGAERFGVFHGLHGQPCVHTVHDYLFAGLRRSGIAARNRFAPTTSAPRRSRRFKASAGPSPPSELSWDRSSPALFTISRTAIRSRLAYSPVVSLLSMLLHVLRQAAGKNKENG